MFRRCQRVLRSIKGCSGCILCQKWLRLCGEVDECKPLPRAGARTGPHRKRLPVSRVMLGGSGARSTKAPHQGAYTRPLFTST